MPTSFLDQFFIIDPYSPPPAGTAMNFVKYTLTDQNDDGDIDRFDGDSVNGQDVTSSWPGDTVTINVPGVGAVTYIGTTFYLADGTQVFTPTDGQVLQNGTLVSATGVTTQGPLNTGTDLGPPCFTKGTMIRTTRGEVPVEELLVGDMVETLDHGLQPIRWIGCSPTDASGDHAPVVFKPGAIGNTVELSVSPQHRILVQGWQAELYFGEVEVLVPAKHLLNGLDVVQQPAIKVEYFHILFDRHEVVTSNGVFSESFFPGDQILMQDREIQAELFELFPGLVNGSVLGYTARSTVKRREARVLQQVA